jgi:hypothetical protein
MYTPSKPEEHLEVGENNSSQAIIGGTHRFYEIESYISTTATATTNTYLYAEPHEHIISRRVPREGCLVGDHA